MSYILHTFQLTKPPRPHQAHEALLVGIEQYPDNAEVLWRLAKSYRNLATLEDKRGNADLKKENIFQGKLQALISGL